MITTTTTATNVLGAPTATTTAKKILSKRETIYNFVKSDTVGKANEKKG